MKDAKQADLTEAIKPVEDIETSTDIIEAAPQGLATMDQDVENFLQESADQEPEEDSIPIVKLMQKDDHIGKFYSEDIGMVFDDGMEVCILKVQESMILWPEEYSKDSEPECKSDDGLNPSEAIEAPMCSEPDCCKAVWDKSIKKMVAPCPYANWNDEKPPRCKQVRNLLLLEVGEQSFIPYWYGIKSTAMAPYRKLSRKLNLQKKGLTARRKRMGLSPAHSCMFSVKMNSELKENKSGDAYVPTFSDPIEITDEGMLKALIGVAFEVRDRQLASMIDDDDTADVAEQEEF